MKKTVLSIENSADNQQENRLTVAVKFKEAKDMSKTVACAKCIGQSCMWQVGPDSILQIMSFLQGYTLTNCLV